MKQVNTEEEVLSLMIAGWCFSGKTGSLRIYKFTEGMDKPATECKVLKKHVKSLRKKGLIKYINNDVWVLTDKGISHKNL